MCLTRVKRLAAAFVLGLLSFPISTSVIQSMAEAQEANWPSRSVRFIVPFGPGTATDTGARLIADRAQAKWGQPVVVENRPGADGMIAINAFTGANDNHVLLYASSTSFIAHPYTLDKVPYDLEADILPIARVSATVVALGVPAAGGMKTVADFVERARAQPGKLNAAGAAGLPEFSVQAFIARNKLDVARVPYRDLGQATADLGANRIQFLHVALVVLAPIVQAGQVRIAAVSRRTGLQITEGVQTIAESGFPELELDTVVGLYGPRVMSKALRERISRDVIAIVQEPAIRNRFISSYQDVIPAGPDELAETLKQQAKSAAATAKLAGIERRR